MTCRTSCTFCPLGTDPFSRLLSFFQRWGTCILAWAEFLDTLLETPYQKPCTRGALGSHWESCTPTAGTCHCRNTALEISLSDRMTHPASIATMWTPVSVPSGYSALQADTIGRGRIACKAGQGHARHQGAYLHAWLTGQCFPSARHASQKLVYGAALCTVRLCIMVRGIKRSTSGQCERSARLLQDI